MTEKWQGIFKLIEEMGELQQVLGKLGAFPNGTDHPSGVNLLDELWKELADVDAALQYFCVANGHLVGLEFDARRHQKFTLFKKWMLTGIKVDVPRELEAAQVSRIVSRHIAEYDSGGRRGDAATRWHKLVEDLDCLAEANGKET
ncbi:MAG: hypothetical protein AB7Q00_14405 [Phycisphaerales bacterium]